MADEIESLRKKQIINSNVEDSGFRSNPLLKRCNVEIKYTEDELEEYIKCTQDPIYFIENYVKIVTLDDGFVPFNLYDCQKEMIKVIHENRRVVGRVGRQSGKCIQSSMELNLRNKKTGEIMQMSIGDFFDKTKSGEILP